MVPKFIRSLLRATRGKQAEFYARQLPIDLFKTHQAEIKWITNYREEHKRYPSLHRFKRRFPNTPTPKSKDSLDELVQEIIDQDILGQLSASVEKARELYSSGTLNIRAVTTALKDRIAEINLFDVAYTDASFGDRGAIQRRYKDRVTQYSENPALLEFSPWPMMNKLIGSVDFGELFTIASRTSIGKAQPLSSKILTPEGFIEMGSVKVGSILVDSTGKPQKVLQIHPQGRIPVFKVTFNDGTTVRCCDDHLWYVSNHEQKKVGDYSFRPVKLKDIRRKLKYGKRLLWEVPHFKGDHSKSRKKFLLHPWVVGALIGDGCLRRDIVFTKKDPEVIARLQALLPRSDVLVKERFAEFGWRIKRRVRNNEKCLTETLIQDLSLRGKKSYEKTIPIQYLEGSFEQRLQLLQGLMDTDGSVVKTGQSYEHYTSSVRLHKQVISLIRSLGGFVKTFQKRGSYVKNGKRTPTRICYICRFQMHSEAIPVSVSRHYNKIKLSRSKIYRKMIVSVVPDGIEESQCLTVSSKDHLYVTDGYTLTHNTWLAIFWAHHQLQLGEKVLFITKEMPTAQIQDRFVALAYRLPYSEYRRGDLPPKVLAKFNRALMRDKHEYLQNLVTSGHETLKGVGFSHIISKIQQYNPTVLWVDGAYLLHPEGISKQAGMAEKIQAISTSMKRLAMHFKIKVHITIQAKRETENKEGEANSKLKDLFGGDAWAQDSDSVLIVNGKRGSSLRRIEVAKCRDGNVGEYSVMFRLNPFPSFKQLGAALMAGGSDTINFKTL